MHEIDKLTAAYALKFLQGKTLSRLDLLNEFTQRKIPCSSSKLWQVMQRLKYHGLIEEELSDGRDKPYKLTREGVKEIKEIKKILHEGER